MAGLLPGLAGWLEEQYIKKYLGNNELQYRWAVYRMHAYSKGCKGLCFSRRAVLRCAVRKAGVLVSQARRCSTAVKSAGKKTSPQGLCQSLGGPECPSKRGDILLATALVGPQHW